MVRRGIRVMNDIDDWPDDYFASRERFVALARRSGARVASHPVRPVGPQGEPLSVDVAVIGAPRAAHLIVMSSGVHGVEGLLGGCIQRQALRSISRAGLPEDTRIALVHAVNPWGFAHRRRVDESNVDVNRNFIDPSEPLPASHHRYAELDPLINPTGLPDAFDEWRFWLHAARLLARERAFAALAEPIASGQHDHPKGLFYGGTGAGESSRLLQSILLELSTDADRVTHLDLHTGLGPSAVATLIGNTNIGDVDGRQHRLRAHYDQPVRLDDAPDNPYDAHGTLSRWYQRHLSHIPFTYLCVEIGTVNPLSVLSALRRENRAHHWAHQWASPGTASRARAGQALLDVFAPRSGRWRRRSLQQGARVFRGALES